MDDLKKFLKLFKGGQSIPDGLYVALVQNEDIPKRIKTVIKRARKMIGGTPCIEATTGTLIGSGSFGSVYAVSGSADTYVKVFNNNSKIKVDELLKNIQDIYNNLVSVVGVTTFAVYKECLIGNIKLTQPPNTTIQGYFLKKCDGTLTKYFSYFMNLINTFAATYPGPDNQPVLNEACEFVLEYISSAMDICYNKVYYINMMGVIMGDVKNDNILYTERIVNNETKFDFFLHDFDGACIYPLLPIEKMCTPMTSHPLFMKYCIGAFPMPQTTAIPPTAANDFLIGLLNQQQLIKNISSASTGAPNKTFIAIYNDVMVIVDDICEQFMVENTTAYILSTTAAKYPPFIYNNLDRGHLYLTYLLTLTAKQLEMHLKFMDLYSLAMTALWTSKIYKQAGRDSDKICDFLESNGRSILKRYLGITCNATQVGGNMYVKVFRRTSSLRHYFLKNKLVSSPITDYFNVPNKLGDTTWLNFSKITGLYTYNKDAKTNTFIYGDSTYTWDDLIINDNEVTIGNDNNDLIQTWIKKK